MKSSLRIEVPNGPTGDPLAVVRFRWIPRIVLFDAGEMSEVAPRTLLNVSDVFISHAHLDHVFGLPRLLRLRLGQSEKPLRLYGPEGFCERVSHLLQSYSWNLGDHYPLHLDVVEIHADRCERWEFPRRSGFDPYRAATSPGPYDAPVFEDDLISVSARILQHGTLASICYRLDESMSIHVNGARLAELGLEPGPWLGVLKTSIRSGETEDTMIDLGGQKAPGGQSRLPLAQIRDLIIDIAEGESLAYATDFGPEEENLQTLIAFAAGCRRLLIECQYLAEDQALSRANAHLSTAEVGRIARDVASAKIHPFHVSIRNYDRLDEVRAELEAACHPIEVEWI